MKKFTLVVLSIVVGIATVGCEGEKNRKPITAVPSDPADPADSVSGGSNGSTDPGLPVGPATPSVPGVTEGPVKSLRESLVGEWLDCSEGLSLSRSSRFVFTAETLSLTVTYHENGNCEGAASSDVLPQTYPVRYSLSDSAAFGNAHDFDYTLLDGSDNVTGTIYTSIRLEGNRLVMSRGAEDLNPQYGDGKTSGTRFRFPEDDSRARNRILTRVLD